MDRNRLFSVINGKRIAIGRTAVSRSGKESYVNTHCPKPVYRMWKILSRLSDTLPEEDVKELVEAFNEHGEASYSRGSEDEAMSNSEDI